MEYRVSFRLNPKANSIRAEWAKKLQTSFRKRRICSFNLLIGKNHLTGWKTYLRCRPHRALFKSFYVILSSECDTKAKSSSATRVSGWREWLQQLSTCWRACETRAARNKKREALKVMIKIWKSIFKVFCVKRGASFTLKRWFIAAWSMCAWAI